MSVSVLSCSKSKDWDRWCRTRDVRRALPGDDRPDVVDGDLPENREADGGPADMLAFGIGGGGLEFDACRRAVPRRSLTLADFSRIDSLAGILLAREPDPDGARTRDNRRLLLGAAGSESCRSPSAASGSTDTPISPAHCRKPRIELNTRSAARDVASRDASSSGRRSSLPACFAADTSLLSSARTSLRCCARAGCAASVAESLLRQSMRSSVCRIAAITCAAEGVMCRRLSADTEE